MSDESSHKSVRPAPSGSSIAPQPQPLEGSSSHASGSSSNAEMTVISSRTPVPSLAFGRGAASLEAGSLLEGERLGQFVLQKFIGGGGMGIVFRALDTTLNREVALKVLSRDQSADEEALRRFRNEAQSAARLDHENIARVHYVGEDRGVHYIVFEFIEGVNIRDLVEKHGPLPLDQAASYTFQIAQALDHASQRAVIHRDIKPSNVLITPDGKAKLVDMGLARLHQVAQVDDLTASGVTLWTFDYISPEQARDPRSADVRSDLYSLGCSFFYMLTGSPPFPDGTVLQKLLQHQADNPPDPRTIRPELPVEVSRILARLLAKNPAQRFQNPGELVRELNQLAEQLGVHLSSPRMPWTAPRPAPPARWRHHVPWVASLAALLLIVFVLDRFEAPETTPMHSAGAATPANARGPTKSATDAPSRRPDATARPKQGDQLKAPSESDPTATPQRSEKTGPSAASPTAAADVPSRAADQRITAPARADQSPDEQGLSFQSSSAQAVAAPEAAAEIVPQPSGSPAELGVSTDRPAADAPRGPSAGRTPAREGLLIVSDTEQGPRTYASLRAAVGDAKSGDTIELRFSGRRVEKPITILNTRLTLRAGEQYQPVIVFRPEANPVEYPPSMVTIAGGQLTVAGVHWELDLSPDVPAEWALFETRRAEVVRFERSTFTIRNASLDQTAYHAGVAFFDVKAGPGSSSMAKDPTATDDQVVTIELANCVVRGEATLVRDNDLQALKLNWDNGLLATSERLLAAAGGPSQPRQLGQVQINLRHVTAAVHAGLALLTNSEDAPYQLPTQLNCTDSIVLATANAPLIEQRGSDDIDEYLGRCEWSGDRDFFSGFEIFWQIVNTGGQTASKEMRFSDWREFWAGRLKYPSNASLAWRGLPSATRPFHTHKPSDYALDSSKPANPAIRAASDGLDAGCLEAQLAALPAEDRGSARPPERAPKPAAADRDGS